MSWRQEFSELLQFLDESTVSYPIRLFNNSPEKDSTPVRRIAFVFENMMEQLKRPLVPSTQALAQALIYKFNGPHRRQGYWMIYKNLSRALRKYNEDDLLGRVSDIHKKATASGAGFYMPSNDVIRYIGGAYLKRLFRLQQIRDLSIRTAHVIMGQLELGHWEKFSLFIVAMCADISSGITKQASSMESVYDSFSDFLIPLDGRFPDCLSDLSILSDLRGRQSGQKTVDTARVMRLLQMTDDQLDAMRTKEQMARFRDEVLSGMDVKDDSIDLGVTIERDLDEKSESDAPSSKLRKVSVTDSGLEIESEPSSSAADIVFDNVEDEILGKMQLAAEKEQKKTKKIRKRKKNSLLQCTVNASIDSSILDKTSALSVDTSLTDCSSTKMGNKKKRKRDLSAQEDASLPRLPHASLSLLSLSETLSSIKKKKRKSDKVLSTNFDLSEELIGLPVTSLDETSYFTPKKKLKKKHDGSSTTDKGKKRKSIDTIPVLEAISNNNKKKKRVE